MRLLEILFKFVFVFAKNSFIYKESYKNNRIIYVVKMLSIRYNEPC